MTASACDSQFGDDAATADAPANSTTVATTETWRDSGDFYRINPDAEVLP